MMTYEREVIICILLWAIAIAFAAYFWIKNPGEAEG